MSCNRQIMSDCFFTKITLLKILYAFISNIVVFFCGRIFHPRLRLCVVPSLSEGLLVLFKPTGSWSLSLQGLFCVRGSTRVEFWL